MILELVARFRVVILSLLHGGEGCGGVCRAVVAELWKLSAAVVRRRLLEERKFENRRVKGTLLAVGRKAFVGGGNVR